MKIGIDISQVIYGTGVSNYIKNLCINLLKTDNENNYILFGAALRGYPKLKEFANSVQDFPNVKCKILPIPNFILELLFNRLRIFPIEKIIGPVDIFYSFNLTHSQNKNKKGD